MSVYFINDKQFETSEATCLFSDGMFSNTGVNFYKTDSGVYVREYTTKWQGQHNSVEQISEKAFIEAMIGEQEHPDRAMEALKIAEIDVNTIIPRL